MLSKEQLEKIANPGAADIGGTQSPIVTQMAIELLESRAESLSLREQLAELKALPPAAYLIHEKGGARQLRFLGLNAVSQADIEEHELWQEPLFTAAKPTGLDVEDITEFMRKAFWRGFESARGTGNSNIPEHWKDSKPNLLLALKAKISGA
ncbi:hypothetical protein ACQIBV_004480 [Yersinia enterocolitica]|uniref:hypothetical protein n=2 Tax=Yersinia enterocolitica TaxID=630 RepID=UPI002AC54DE7|nr:hypothetical protein [Yersinia enterocolitica]EKN4063080.1 hypothetical protein [Yersinia enterocolitica]EKN4904610.1 hypothetical protein [Yersinia enterocolitica]EKN5121429.1 hypothetical protein [Yersinia enterocolitica]HDM8431787.1 hypothetical protein [Yersinia enterocolitica]